jgi:Superinfection immunity protein
MEIVNFAHLPVLLLLVGLYLLPAIVAYGRHHPSRRRIALLSLLLGWFPLVWLGALIWAGQPRSRWATGPAA